MKVRKGKRNSLKENYRQSWNFIKESKNYIYFSVLIFLVFTLIGFFAPASESLTQKIFEFIEELLLKTQDMSYLGLIWFIFFNNLQSSFFGMIYGILFGAFPVMAALVNGYLLGFVASEASSREGIFVLLRLLPHGIFELPALFISLGLGIKIGTFILNKEKIKTLKNYLTNSVKIFFLIIVPLLFIAAIIEGTFIFFSG